MKYPMLVLTVIVLLAVALGGCAAPGQPPNFWNFIVGEGDIVGGNISMNLAQKQLNDAYNSHQISADQYRAMSDLALKARTDLVNLGHARLLNQTVTQAQVDAAVQEFTGPLSDLLASLIPGTVTVLPIPVPAATKP